MDLMHNVPQTVLALSVATANQVSVYLLEALTAYAVQPTGLDY